MSRKLRTVKGQDVQKDMPDLIRRALDSAVNKLKPQPNQEDDQKLPLLVEFLTPYGMPDPSAKKPEEAKDVIREALLMLSFDFRSGAWKVSVSDKMNALGGSMIVTSLSTAFLELERAFKTGSFEWSAKPTS
jgi:hypothetical protein